VEDKVRRHTQEKFVVKKVDLGLSFFQDAGGSTWCAKTHQGKNVRPPGQKTQQNSGGALRSPERPLFHGDVYSSPGCRSLVMLAIAMMAQQ
jgi:hypothetical protein